MHSACTFPAVKSSEAGAITQGANAPLHIFTAWHTCRFFYRYPAAGLIGHKVRHVSLPARPEIRWHEQKAFDGAERDSASGIPSAVRILPNVQTLLLGYVQRILLRDIEGLIPRVDVRQSTVHAPFAQ